MGKSCSFKNYDLIQSKSFFMVELILHWCHQLPLQRSSPQNQFVVLPNLVAKLILRRIRLKSSGLVAFGSASLTLPSRNYTLKAAIPFLRSLPS
ncbi:hypothetical protein RHSIM_Rhsim10G0093200 [Rhododendron simsii]|uniref:Uncharacterized protein n=1 Tax=Rhododendron simsii TaxID=118357 RepID=A0A834LCY1_RHOSS|nr:hypothetical protein RHSIM_Rhsim10G0093200 [Rhododendron simsii]